MSALTIPTDALGHVVVLAIDLPAEQVEAFTRADAPNWLLRDALGATSLDADDVTVFAAADLSGVGLAAYLTEGYGVAETALASQRAEIDAERGTIAVIPGRAFGGVAQTLSPRPPLRLIGHYQEEGMARHDMLPLPDASARGTLTGRGGSEPAPRGLNRGVLLTALVLLVLALVVFALIRTAA